jgi:hypothetical protein
MRAVVTGANGLAKVTLTNDVPSGVSLNTCNLLIRTPWPVTARATSG